MTRVLDILYGRKRASSCSLTDNWFFKPGTGSEPLWGSGGTDDVFDSVCFNGTTYVVGVGGKLASSSNGSTWEFLGGIQKTTFGTNDVRGIISDGAKMVAVGAAGNIAYSTNGTTWNYVGAPVTQQLNKVAYAFELGGLFVAVGVSGRLLTATNPTTLAGWTNRTAAISGTTYGATDINFAKWNGSQFLIGGPSGKLATSPDGIVWTYQGGLAATGWGTGTVNDAAWDGSRWVVVGNGGRVAYSNDGISWTYVGTPVNTNILYAIEYSSSLGLFIAVGDTRKIITASDPTVAANWTSRTPTTGDHWYTITQCSGQLIVAGNGAAISTSLNATAWTNQTGLQNPYPSAYGVANINAIAYGNGTYVIVGNLGSVATSTNGDTWLARTGLTGGINDVGFGNGKFVALGSLLRIWTSTDNGVTWTQTNATGAAGTPTFNAVAYNGSIYVAVGTAGALYTSPDAVTWTSRTTLSSNASWGNTISANDIIWNSTLNQFVIVGASGKIARVNNTGMTVASVTTLPSSATLTLNAIAWNGTTNMIAVGSTGTIARTTNNGAAWTEVATGLTGFPFNSVIWDTEKFILAGDPALAKSSDGSAWTSVQSSLAATDWSLPSFDNINDLLYDGTAVWAAGDNGKVAKSIC